MFGGIYLLDVLFEFFMWLLVIGTFTFIYFMFRPGWRGITRKKAIIHYVLLLVVVIFGCAFTITPERKAHVEQRKQAEQQKKDAEVAEKNIKAGIENLQHEKSKQVLDKLDVTVDIQEQMDSKDNHKVVVWLKNNSDYTVSVNVNVMLKDAAKNTVDSDTAYFENIEPHKGGYAISWLKTKRVTSYEYTNTIEKINP